MAHEGRRDQRLAAKQAAAIPAEGPARLKRGRRLPRSFFERSSVDVAPDLLGRVLIRRLPGGTRLSARIVEVEAYTADDPASHAYRGMTPRNAVMFGPAGHLYVYFTYGMHFCMNVVTGEPGEGAAVLLRAAEPLEGIGEMRRSRGREALPELCSGPAKLCESFGIDRSCDGLDLARSLDLWIMEGDPEPRSRIATGPRVGIRVAMDRQWRYWVRDDRWVSRGRLGRAVKRSGSSDPSKP